MLAADQPPYDPIACEGSLYRRASANPEVSMALKRCYANGLAKRDRHSGARAQHKVFVQDLVHGLRYVFPAKPER